MVMQHTPSNHIPCHILRHDKSCQRWKLGGEWSPRNRKIYYAFLVDNELALLTILLEEIYDVVDHIILQEADMSWRYQKKPKFFTKFKESHFKRYGSQRRFWRSPCLHCLMGNPEDFVSR